MVEQRPVKALVAGSSPAPGAKGAEQILLRGRKRIHASVQDSKTLRAFSARKSARCTEAVRFEKCTHVPAQDHNLTQYPYSVIVVIRTLQLWRYCHDRDS